MELKEKRKKRKAFWYGWVKDAAITLKISRAAVLRRLKHGEPNLIEWLDSELKRRERSRIKATELVTEFNPEL